jgi:hypothetical protein
LSALERAGAFYGVARNLPTKFDVKKNVKRYQPVLEILDAVSKEQFNDDPVNTVNRILEIEREISAKYGDKRVLSLTTKFLWLKIKEPILIYDSQARIAVGSKDGDLADYYNKWGKGFTKHQKQIEKVSSRLSELNLYAVDQEVGTKECINDVSSKTWFHKRIFDIYLWNKGNNSLTTAGSAAKTKV